MLLHAVFALETLDATGSIDEALLASIERMALGADFHMHFRQRRASLERIAACTGDHAASVLWMDSGFHLYTVRSDCNH